MNCITASQMTTSVTSSPWSKALSSCTSLVTNTTKALLSGSSPSNPHNMRIIPQSPRATFSSAPCLSQPASTVIATYPRPPSSPIQIWNPPPIRSISTTIRSSRSALWIRARSLRWPRWSTWMRRWATHRHTCFRCSWNLSSRSDRSWKRSSHGRNGS